MNKPLIYVETTIPSFYHDDRAAADIVARRMWTRQWWDEAKETHSLVTSEAVLDELLRGPESRHAAWLELIKELPV